MAKGTKRYKVIEQYVTYGLIAECFLFVVYLLFAAQNILFFKFLTATLIFCLSGLCLWVLFVNNELTRQRSLWMTCGASAIIVCLFVSLITNFPG